MLKFLLKKNFCDIWDNLFHFLIVNLINLALLMIGIAAASFIAKNLLTSFIVFVIINCILNISLFAEGNNVKKIANFESPKLKNYFSNILPSIKIALQFGTFTSILTLIAFVSIPYYFNMWLPTDGSKGNILGLFLLSFVFWFEVVSILSLQWFAAIYNLMGNSFLKCLKKSYIIFFDNTLVSIVIGLLNLLGLLFTIFSLGMVCSIDGMMLTNTNALRLLLYKYDWYEVNPELTKAERKDVPWDDLLEKDKTTLGPRKLKTIIFPWKEA